MCFDDDMTDVRTYEVVCVCACGMPEQFEFNIVKRKVDMFTSCFGSIGTDSIGTETN